MYRLLTHQRSTVENLRHAAQGPLQSLPAAQKLHPRRSSMLRLQPVSSSQSPATPFERQLIPTSPGELNNCLPVPVQSQSSSLPIIHQQDHRGCGLATFHCGRSPRKTNDSYSFKSFVVGDTRRLNSTSAPTTLRETVTKRRNKAPAKYVELLQGNNPPET